MTEFEGLYKAVIKLGPQDIQTSLENIPGIHKQEALDNALEKAITLSLKPSINNIKYLLHLGADPNGPSGEEGFALNYAYTSGYEPIVELLLLAGADVNATHSNVLEQAVKKADLPYVVRFVEAGANINDSSKYTFTSNLFGLSNDPDIQKYLLSKGLDTTGIKMPKNLDSIDIPKIDEFDYVDPGYNPSMFDKISIETTDGSPCRTVDNDELYIKDYSSKYFMVCGNTKNHQNVLKKYGGKFIRRGWIVPISKKELIQNTIDDMVQTPAVNEATEESEEVDYNTLETHTPTPVENIVDVVISNTTVKRPSIVNKDNIELYTPIGKYGFMTISYSRPKLFYLDSHYWDSVERYLMFKMYEGSKKAEAIKKAETLEDARIKFNVKNVPIAKTPKQLVINKKLQPLAESSINKNYIKNREHYIINANKAKFYQNKLFMNKLAQTAPKYIINKNGYDMFSYEGNLLGNTLVNFRDQDQSNLTNNTKTNNITMEKYTGNTHFYIIRGDPDQQKAAEIRKLGTYKTKMGKIIRGKLNLNLQGGPGWLIPQSKKSEAKKLIFDTFPDDKKIQLLGREWIKNRVKKFLQVAIIFSKFRDHREVGSDDLMFSIRDIFGGQDFYIVNDTPPDNDFKDTIWKYAAKHNVTISDNTIKLLWDFLSKMAEEITTGVETSTQMKKILNNIEHSVLDMQIDPLPNLTERESIIISSFIRIYRLLKRISVGTESKACVTAVHMMLGDYYYEEIRNVYAKKIKMKGGKSYDDEESQFIERFDIQTPHTHEILEILPSGLSKKCKLLVMTTVDYIMNLEDDDAIALSKRLIILSQKGRQPSPTPSIESISFSDIPQIDPEQEFPESPGKSPIKVTDIKIDETPTTKMPSDSPPKSPPNSPPESPPNSPEFNRTPGEIKTP